MELSTNCAGIFDAGLEIFEHYSRNSILNCAPHTTKPPTIYCFHKQVITLQNNVTAVPLLATNANSIYPLKSTPDFDIQK